MTSVTDLIDLQLTVKIHNGSSIFNSEEDFNKYKGNRVKIKTTRSINGQKNFKGILLGISSGQVNLQLDEQIVAIPNQDILKARLDD